VYPLLGVENPQFGVRSYRGGNLVVIEKCYNWQNCCETDVGPELEIYYTDIDVWMQENYINPRIALLFFTTRVPLGG